MKKLMSINYSTGAFTAGMLIFRIAFGALIMHHGYDKLVHFSEYQDKFKIAFLGLSPTISLSLVVFAEFFCGLFIIIGLFTRFAALVLVINMAVAVFKAHNADVFGPGEMATLFLGGFLLLSIIGPGKASVDGMIGK